jgi:hypothetical protein
VAIKYEIISFCLIKEKEEFLTDYSFFPNNFGKMAKTGRQKKKQNT